MAATISNKGDHKIVGPFEPVDGKVVLDLATMGGALEEWPAHYIQGSADFSVKVQMRRDGPFGTYPGPGLAEADADDILAIRGCWCSIEVTTASGAVWVRADKRLAGLL